MTSRRRTGWIVLLTWLIVPFALAAEALPQERVRAEAFLGQWLAAWRAQDLDAYLSLYAADARVDGKDRARVRKAVEGAGDRALRGEALTIAGAVVRVTGSRRCRSNLPEAWLSTWSALNSRLATRLRHSPASGRDCRSSRLSRRMPCRAVRRRPRSE